MSRNSINLDSPGALHAFRVAMGLATPSGSARNVEAIEDAESTDSTDESKDTTKEEIVSKKSERDTAGDISISTTKENYSRSPILNQDLATENTSSNIPYHEDTGGSLALDHALNPIDNGLRVPQNSPATGPAAAPSPPAMPPKADDGFTTEEAHDVVIDIFKELAALSEKVQARNAAMKKSNISPASSQPIPPIATSSGSTSMKPPVDHPDSSEVNQSGLASIPEKSRSMPNSGALGSQGRFLPPHLRMKVKQKETSSKDSPVQHDILSPHLRALKQRDRNVPAPNASANYYASLNPEHQSSFSHDRKQPGFKTVPRTHAGVENSLKIGSIQSASGATSGTSSTPAVNGKENDMILKTVSARSVSPKVIALDKADKEGTTLQSHPGLPSKSSETSNSPQQKPKSPHQTDLAPSFLDKWGSKGRTLPPKASVLSGEKSKDLENQLVFKAWPGQVIRSRPAADIRTCHIKQVPSSASPAFICSLVFGGALEYVKVHTDPTTFVASATIRFLSGDACKRFYDATANGLPFKHGSSSHDTIAWVTLGKEVDVIGGLLAQQIEQGATRCVRAVLVDAELNAVDLKQLASEKGRQLEGYEETITPNGSRRVIWRFCDIAHAVAFRGVLARNQDFESCNVTFTEDPCAIRKEMDV